MKRILVVAAYTRIESAKAKAKIKRVFMSEVFTFRCSNPAGRRKDLKTGYLRLP